MSPSRGTRPAAPRPLIRPAPSSSVEGSGGSMAWAPLAVACAGIAVFQGALRYFFAQDDFAGLGRAAGILPRLTGVWRYLSGQLYFDVMWWSAGLHAWAYHSVSIAAHLGCAVLLYDVLARRFSRAAALLGAMGFVTHASLYTAIYSISGIGEILACFFALAALRLAVAPRPWSWAAPVAFGLSLLCKESTLLLPLAMAIGFCVLPRERKDVRAIALACGLLAAVYALDFARSDVFSVRRGLPENAAYALATPGDAGRNLLTYLGWTLNLFLPTVRGVGDAVDPLAFPWGVALAAAWIAGFFSPALRSRGWGAAGASYLLFLLPVLPLRSHTYHYYLYAPMAAAAYGAAAAFDGLVVTRLSKRWEAITSGALAVALTLNGALLVRKIETVPFIGEDMRADATVDRARIARQVYDALREARLPAGARLTFWSPALASSRRDPSRLSTERYWADNVRSALFDGVGVRVMFPQVAGIDFVEGPPGRTADRVAIYQRNGRLTVMTAAQVDSLLALHPID